MATLDRQVGASSDDCLRRLGSDFFGTTYDGFNAGYLNATYYEYGSAARFLNVTIPKGATITAAYLSVKTLTDVRNNATKTRLRAQDADNAATFSTQADFDARTWTTEYVYWDFTPVDDAWHNSAEIKTLIQAIVNRANWASGNALAILWDDWENRSAATNGFFQGKSYETSTTECPKLHIEYVLPQTVSPSGIEQPLAYGTPNLNFILYPSGIAQALAYGTPEVQLGAGGLTIQPSGIEQLVALGTPAVQPGAVTISPSGIEQTLAYGTPKLIFVLSPSGIAQALAYGSPKLNFTLYPSGITQPIVIGTPALRYPQTLSPQGIAVTILYGTPSVGVYGIIGPSGIEQVIAIGSPQLLKYVWHVILDGQYITESPDINRAYVIGRDANGNPVYGTAVDSTELGLVGERLDFQQELAIPTEAKAGEVASAILAKMRLTTKRGVILIPPNCGQELWDVVQLTDSLGNQLAIKFRVVGIRTEYNPKQARYQHKLILGAP